MNHVIDISTKGAVLRVRDGLLSLQFKDEPEVTVPLGEVAALVLACPQTTLTQPVLSGLASAGAAVISCDERYMPIAMSLPLTGYHAPARRMMAQAKASRPMCKRLWRQIVRVKVRAQGSLLKELRGDDFGLLAMADLVRSGDAENVEGQAARVYWPALFDDVAFLRRTDLENQNRYLNYGYAVLRAVVARAICAAGLHPGLGIFHHHRENAYCLADDLMESLRPVVDRKAVEVTAIAGPDAPMDTRVKGMLLEVATQRYDMEGQKRTLFDVAAIMASSLAMVFEGQRRELILPEL